MVNKNILKGPFHYEEVLKPYKLLTLSKYNSNKKTIMSLKSLQYTHTSTQHTNLWPTYLLNLPYIL